MIRKVVKKTINIEGGVLSAGATFKLELKKESKDLEKPIFYNTKELDMTILGGGGWFTLEEKINKEEDE